MVDEYVAVRDLISRLGNAMDRGVLLAIAAGTTVNLENTFAAEESAKRLEEDMRDPDVKIEAVYDENTGSTS